MRIPLALVVLVASSSLVLGACSGNVAVEVESSPAASPSVSESGEEASSISVDESRTASFARVDTGMLGMHVAGAQEGDWQVASVPVASFWLCETGTSWLQIEAPRDRYDWRLLDTALEIASAAGVTDALMVLGPTPVTTDPVQVVPAREFVDLTSP